MDIPATLKDAAYITIGLSVIGFQKAQVRRVEISKQLDSQVADLRKQLDGSVKTLEFGLTEAREQFSKAVKDLEVRVQPLLEQFETNIATGLDAVEERLPKDAKEIVHNARAAAKDATDTVRARIAS